MSAIPADVMTNPGPAGVEHSSPPVVLAPTMPTRRRGRARDLSLSLLCALLGMGAFVGLWAFVAALAPDLPTPTAAWSALGTLLGDAFVAESPNGRGIALQLGDSLLRTLQGFGVAAVVGIPLGLAIGTSRRAFQAVNPTLQILRPVSPLAWFPLGLVVLKDTQGAAIFVIFITALWPMVLNAAAGAASVPADQRNVARVFRFSRRTYVRRILIPHCIPSILTGARLSMGIAWMVIVAAEMLSGDSGIGFFVWNSYNGGNLSFVISAILLIGIVGVALDGLLRWVGRRYTGEVAR